MKNKAMAQQQERKWFNQATKARNGVRAERDITLTDFISVFEEERLASRSPKTVAIYTRSLIQLLEIVGPTVNFNDISVKHIAQYKRSMKNGELSPYNINKRLRALGTAFRWAIKHKYARMNPTIEVDKLKTPQKLPLEIPKADVRSLIEGSRGKWIGDYIRAAAYGGFRSSEITGISEDDIDFNNRYVKVTGKFNKQRHVPLFPSLKNLFTDILNRLEDEDLRYLKRSGHDGRAPGMLFYQVASSTVVYHAFKAIIKEKWPSIVK